MCETVKFTDQKTQQKNTINKQSIGLSKMSNDRRPLTTLFSYQPTLENLYIVNIFTNVSLQLSALYMPKLNFT